MLCWIKKIKLWITSQARVFVVAAGAAAGAAATATAAAM